ncbi:MAG: homoserine kinase [Ilumatobacter sp.]
MSELVVRAPASSANLGAGFDVFGMAVTLFADVGTGAPPDGAQPCGEHHPARAPFARLGGVGPLWLRTNIPMARGLGFSGAVRVAAAGLAVAQSGLPIESCGDEVLAVTAALEGHGDNVVASLHGGVVAYVDGEAIPFPLGPVLAGASFVAWVPDVTTSTDASRRTLGDQVSRADAVHNLGRATKMAMAFAHDDPALLAGAADDRLHQAERLPSIPGASEAIDAGAAAGAWCGWLSGSGPTVGFLASNDAAQMVARSLPGNGHVKVLAIDPDGARVL